MAIQRITSGIIADGAIVATDIGDGIVTNDKLAGSITSDKITSVSNTAISGLIQAAQIGSVSNTALPAGSVLQVVNAKYDTSVTSTSIGTNFDSGLTASITPSSASNKILVLVSSNGVQLVQSSYGKVFLTDGANNLLSLILTPAGYTNSNDESIDSISTCFLHSPNSTSSQTYKVRGVLLSGTTMTFQTTTGGNSESTITLMEIAA
jgi:hypothetical protein